MDQSLVEKENVCPLISVENSEKGFKKHNSKNRSVFTQKNTNKQKEEDKSTGIPNVKSQIVPNKKISSFRLLIGKNLLRDQESQLDNGDISRSKPVMYKEIEFDFSKVKSMAMDVFNGKTFLLIISIYF